MDQFLFSLFLLGMFWIFGQIGTQAAAVAHVVIICVLLLFLPGVGLGMTPPVFLKDGDKMELSVDNLGSQTIKVITE